MIASFDLIEYRRRQFSPARRLAGQVEGLRFWCPLNIGGDFGWFREHPSRRGLYRRLKPDFHRWAYYAVWDDDSALEAFRAQSTVAAAWSDGCSQALHLSLTPVRVRGPWPGMRALEGSTVKSATGGPVAVLARLDLTLRGTVAMWASAAPRLLHHIPDSAELLLGIPLVDRPYVQPVSFSLWRSADSARMFAFGTAGHRDAVARVQSAQADLVTRFSAGRFEPFRSAGTWNGRNPLDSLTDRS